MRRYEVRYWNDHAAAWLPAYPCVHRKDASSMAKHLVKKDGKRRLVTDAGGKIIETWDVDDQGNLVEVNDWTGRLVDD